MKAAPNTHSKDEIRNTIMRAMESFQMGAGGCRNLEERANSITNTNSNSNRKMNENTSPSPRIKSEFERFRGGSVGGRWLRRRGEIQIRRQVQRQNKRTKSEISSGEV